MIFAPNELAPSEIARPIPPRTPAERIVRQVHLPECHRHQSWDAGCRTCHVAQVRRTVIVRQAHADHAERLARTNRYGR